MSLEQKLRRIQLESPTGRAVFLEGRTDPPILLALLGLPDAGAATLLINDVRVVGLGNSGSGRTSVVNHVRKATALGLEMAGIVDGDARPEPGATDLDGAGPLYQWPTYSIENYLRQTWPAPWGAEPDWLDALHTYSAHTAQRVVHRQLQMILVDHGLVKLANPNAGHPLLTLGTLLDRIDSSLPDAEALRSSLQAAYTEHHTTTDLGELDRTTNGKWLIDLAIRQGAKSKEQARHQWCDAIRLAGGVPSVRTWWESLFSK